MERWLKQGRLVVLLGLDGAGKSTQVAMLLERLRKTGRDAVAPTNVSLLPLRASMDEIAVDRGKTDMYDILTADEAHLLISVVKWQGMQRVAEDLAVEGRYVIMDRYSYCYFAGGISLDARKRWIVRELFANFPRPDVAIYLDVPPDEAGRRIETRGVDSVAPEILESMQAAYWQLPESADFVVVDGRKSVDDVHEAIWSEVVRAFPELGARPAGGDR